ncbi:GumC family protein [Methylocystis sp. JAN1]|uniref:GumC family protein n=1 Tax=Methylocystis sp. JAN1 TaxID=3397211 RepID=UPI003FA29A86
MTVVDRAPAAGLARPARGRMDLDMGDFYRALASRWRLLPLCLALTFALAGAYILFTPARYAASMSFLVDTRERPPVGSDATPVPQSPDAALVENQMRLLQSNTVLKRVVEAEHLRDDPEFNEPGLFGRLKNFIFQKARTGPTEIQLAEALARMVTVKRSDKSYVIDLEVRASSTDKAERLAKALAKAFMDANNEMRDSISDQETKWLDQKIDELRRRLEAAEARVQEFRAQNAIVVTDGLTPPEDQLKDANATLVNARGKRAEAEARYEQFLAATRGGTAETLRSPLMERLRVEYAALLREAAQQQMMIGPRHPSAIALQSQIAAQRAQIERETRNMKETQRRELEAAREVERDAEAHVVKLKKAITDSGGRRIELNELERKAESLRDNYQKALAARESTRREIVTSPNPILINQPVAQAGRVSPKTAPAILIALAGGVNLWIVAALVAEYLVRRGGDASPVAPKPSRVGAADRPSGEEFSLPGFGRSAAAQAGGERRSEAMIERVVDIMETPAAPYRRAVLRLYRMLCDDLPKEPAPVVAVGGREPGVGATSLTLSLALLACETGARVLIVEASDRQALARLLPHLKLVGRGDDESAEIFLCRRDPKSGGRIYLCGDGGPPSAKRWLDERFDLVLFDYGASGAPAAGMAIDAVLHIEGFRDGGPHGRLIAIDDSKRPRAGLQQEQAAAG